MGNLNIDLLNSTHSASKEFFNTFKTNFFNSRILQPTLSNPYLQNIP